MLKCSTNAGTLEIGAHNQKYVQVSSIFTWAKLKLSLRGPCRYFHVFCSCVMAVCKKYIYRENMFRHEYNTLFLFVSRIVEIFFPVPSVFLGPIFLCLMVVSWASFSLYQCRFQGSLYSVCVFGSFLEHFFLCASAVSCAYFSMFVVCFCDIFYPGQSCRFLLICFSVKNQELNANVFENRCYSVQHFYLLSRHSKRYNCQISQLYALQCYCRLARLFQLHLKRTVPGWQ